jgi:hypothetical protein
MMTKKTERHNFWGDKSNESRKGKASERATNFHWSREHAELISVGEKRVWFTMGPPPLVVASSNRRSTRTSDVHSPDWNQQHFPRRLPRTGTAFQCKMQRDGVLKDYETSRRAPEIMSEEFPYRTALEMETTMEEASTLSDCEGKATMLVMEDDASYYGWMQCRIRSLGSELAAQETF